MGETQDTLFEPDFNRSIKVQTFSQKITSHAGAVPLREADPQLGLIESVADQIQDPRNPEKIRHTTAELLRERIEESVGSFWKVMTRRIGQLRLASRWTSPCGTCQRDCVPPPPHAHLSLVLRD